MGYYTQLIFSARLKDNMPNEIIETISWLVDQGEKPKNLPKHEFFNCKYAELVLLGQSFYFPQTIRPDFQYDYGWRLTSISNIKNRGEIELYLDWIKQYVFSGSGENNFYAIVCSEEQTAPTIYYLKT